MPVHGDTRSGLGFVDGPGRVGDHVQDCLVGELGMGAQLLDGLHGKGVDAGDYDGIFRACGAQPAKRSSTVSGSTGLTK